MKTPSALILANMFVDTNECASNPCQDGGSKNYMEFILLVLFMIQLVFVLIIVNIIICRHE